MGKNNGTIELEVPVKFGGVSVGDQTTRIGVRIDRNRLKLNEADRVFCGHRLTGRVELGTHDDSNGQERFVPVEKFEGVFDCKRLGWDSSNISTGLTFIKKDVHLDLIGLFAKGNGRIIITQVAEIPEDAPDDDESQKRLPGSLKSDGPWRQFPLSDLLDGALLKALKKAGLTTMGELADYTAADKRLTDIEGIGPGKQAKIEEATLAFFADNENAADEVAAAAK